MSTTTSVSLTVRPATEQDYDIANRLFRTTMGENFVLDTDLWNEVCTNENYIVWLGLKADSAIVALSVVVVSDRLRLALGVRRRRFLIDDLIVAPEFRRQGYARALLEEIKARAALQAPSYISVNCDFTDVAARRTYEAAGLHLVRQSNDRFEIAFP